VIVLHEIVWDTRIHKALLLIGFQEKAALVANNFWFNQNEIRDFQINEFHFTFPRIGFNDTPKSTIASVIRKKFKVLEFTAPTDIYIDLVKIDVDMLYLENSSFFVVDIRNDEISSKYQHKDTK